MAADNDKRSVHPTLVAGVEDVMTLTQCWDEVEVLNRDATQVIYYRTDNLPAVVGAKGTYVVTPGTGHMVRPVNHFAGTVIVRLISTAGGAYSVTGYGG